MPVLLLVEDEVMLANNITRYFGHRGWDVHVAVSAEDALRNFASIAPDVILMDFNPPSPDGLAALTLMRDRDPGVGIVMGAGHSTVQLAVDANAPIVFSRELGGLKNSFKT